MASASSTPSITGKISAIGHKALGHFNDAKNAATQLGQLIHDPNSISTLAPLAGFPAGGIGEPTPALGDIPTPSSGVPNGAPALLEHTPAFAEGTEPQDVPGIDGKPIICDNLTTHGLK